MDSLHSEVMGDDGRDKVSSLVDCFALCLLLRVTLAYGNFNGLSMAVLVRLSLDGDPITGDERGVVRNMVFFELFLCIFHDFLCCSIPPHSFLSVSLFRK